MRGVSLLIVICAMAVSGCLSVVKEPNGRYVTPAQVEIRSAFGTNQSGMRLQRCDGPSKKVLWYSESDFTNCVMLTKPEQDEWFLASSRGAGPEIVGAAIMGGSIGAGAALSGGARATANGSATAVNAVNQTVNVKKH